MFIRHACGMITTPPMYMACTELQSDGKKLIKHDERAWFGKDPGQCLMTFSGQS